MSAIEKNEQTHELVPTETPATATRRGKPTGARKWLYRLAAMTLIPAALFALLEGSLRLGGYGTDTSFFVDGSKIEQREVWIENKNFERCVFPPPLRGICDPIPFVLPKSKAAGTYRIFVLGESAAMGFPNPSFGFARVLEAMLRARYPQTRFEIVNTAIVAINSHVVLPIARQCASQQPDLFIVHLGNNEVVGPFGAAGVLGPFSASRDMIRANLAVKTTRAGQLLQSLVGAFGQAKERPRVWDGMATMARSHVRADDDRLVRINAHFRENLEDICRAGTDTGALVIVCSIPVNLKDSAPFGSLHNPTLADKQLEAWNEVYKAGARHEENKEYAAAIRLYEQASRIDDQFADLSFCLGRCNSALGKTSEAKDHFARARDLDTLRFRTDTTLNRTIREVVAGRNDHRVRLVDAERTFERSSPGGIPGEELFLEHVHMNFKGNCLLARTVFECLAELAPPQLGEGRDDKAGTLSDEQCAERLGYTEWNELNIVKQIASIVTEGKPFTMQFDSTERGKRWMARAAALHERFESGGVKKALAVYQEAVQDAPEDPMLRVALGELLLTLGPAMAGAAEEQFVEALSRVRHDPTNHYRLGELRRMAGRLDEAEGHFRAALRLDPDYMRANFGLAEVCAARGEQDQAIAIYQEQVRKGRNRLLALLTLGGYYDQIGKLDEAREQYLEVLRCSPDHMGALLHLGDLAAKQEKVDEAIEYYETAKRNVPDAPAVRERLARARKLRSSR